jgi:small nuclear ribonucleoprotein (snRNP)-like protein
MLAAPEVLMDDTKLKRLLSNEENFEGLLVAFSRIENLQLRNHVLLLMEELAGGISRIGTINGD